MFNLKAIAWKLFKAAKVHVLTSICIIAVSICLIVTMATYIYNAQHKLERNIDELYGEMDVLAGYDYGRGQYVSIEQYDAMHQLPFVDAISPVSLEMAQIDELNSVYTIGVENDGLAKSRYHFTNDVTADSVLLSELLAKTLNAFVGDNVLLNGQTYEVIEIVPTPAGTEPFNMAIVHNDVLRQSVSAGLFMLIQTDEPLEVAKSLKSLDDQFRIDVVNDYDFVKMNIQTLLVFIIVLSVFILLITGLLLLSTMQLLLTKLKEQLMILRALGATTKQIGQLVQIQLVSIVLLGLVLGTVMSFITIQVFLPQFVKWLRLPEATTQFPVYLVFAIVFITGIILMIYTIVQVRKAMHILPMQLVEESLERTVALTKWKLIFMSVMTTIGLLSLFVGQLDGTGKGALQIILGSLVLAFVVLYMMPYNFQWLLKVTLQPIRKLLGKEAYLACQQLIPQIRLNMKIVLSLVGLTVILVFGSSMLKSLQANEQAYLQERFETDWIVSNTAADMSLDVRIVEQIDKLPDVKVAQATSMGTSVSIEEDSYPFDLFALNLSEYGVVGELDQKIVVTERFAKEENIQVGDMITPYFFDFKSETVLKQAAFEVVKIIDLKEDFIGAHIDWSSSFAKNHMVVQELMIETSNPDQAKEALTELLTHYPTMQLLEKKVAMEEANMMFYQRWSLFIGVFIVLLVATAIGIIQTLLHLIYTNREQYIIQRLLGLTPKGLIKLLCMQVLSFVLYGLVAGLVVGGVLTRLVALIDKEGQVVFDFMTLGIVSFGLLMLMLFIFGLQGYLMSRQKLASEITQL